jgi:hypothetical protein
MKSAMKVIAALTLLALTVGVGTLMGGCGCNDCDIEQPVVATMSVAGIVPPGETLPIPMWDTDVDLFSIPGGCQVAFASNGQVEIISATLSSGGLAYFTPTTRAGQFSVSAGNYLSYTGSIDARVTLIAVTHDEHGEEVETGYSIELQFVPSLAYASGRR